MRANSRTWASAPVPRVVEMEDLSSVTHTRATVMEPVTEPIRKPRNLRTIIGASSSFSCDREKPALRMDVREDVRLNCFVVRSATDAQVIIIGYE